MRNWRWGIVVLVLVESAAKMFLREQLFFVVD